MKKVICMILVMAVMLTNTATALAQTYVNASLSYTNGNVIYLTSSNALVCEQDGDLLIVKGYNLSNRYGKGYDRITVPAKYQGKSIVLDEGALSGIPVKKIIFEEGIYYLPNGLCRGSGMLEEVVIPQSVREIGDYAFKDCPNLMRGGTIYAETIGDEAFFGCNNLCINVQNARNIGSKAFEGCKSVTGVEGYENTEVVFNSGEATVGGITYAVKGNEVRIIKCDKFLQGEVVIPSEIAGYPVTEISYHGFYDCGYIKKVVLPDTMKSIGTRAFWNCYSLREVVLNKGLETIGEEAFECCEQLKSIAIPDSVTKIGDMAFKGSGIENIEMGNGVKYIGDGAFWNCNNLIGITIPDNVVSLGTDASTHPSGYFGGLRTDKKLSPFYSCGKLVRISIGKGVKNIHPDMFFNCDILEEINISEEHPSYTSVDGVVYTKDMKKLLCYPKGRRNISFTIPQGVCEIGENAFCTETLQTLYTPESLVDIHGDNIIPQTTIVYKNVEEIPVEVVEENLVRGVYNNIEWSIDKGILTLSGQGSLKTTLDGKYTPVPWKIEDVKEVVVGEGILEIHGVFKNHINMTNIILPQSLKGIYDLSFYNCKSLEMVNIPVGVNYIGTMAFGECYSLKDVKVLSVGEVEIYRGAFDIADGAVVYLPDNVKWMDKYAFNHIYSTGTNQFGAKNKPQDVTVVANSGSYPEEWAVKNGVKFKTPPGAKVGERYLTGSNVYEEKGIMYLSGKAAFEALGVNVDCDDKRKIAVCGAGSDWMIFTENDTVVATSTGSITVKTPAKWINGVFMVPMDMLVVLGFNQIEITQASTIENLEEETIGGVISVSLDNITVSQVPERENGPYNMIDGLIQTRWAAEVTDKNNPCWAVFDLGEVCEIDKIGLSFYRDSIRTSEFSVEVSVDGVEYKEAIPKRNSMGRSEEIEYYSMNNVKARYVKLSGYGNSSPYDNIKNWFSPTQVEIYKAGTVIVPGEEKVVAEISETGKFDLRNAKVTASIISEPQNSADKLYDGSFSTYCVLYVQDEADPQFIQIDLGDVYDIEKLALAFRWPDRRTTFFDIRVSEDGREYKTVVPKSASDSSAKAYEYFGIHENARYIRVYGYSNTYNRNWVSITEAEVYVNK